MILKLSLCVKVHIKENICLNSRFFKVSLKFIAVTIASGLHNICEKLEVALLSLCLKESLTKGFVRWPSLVAWLP